MAIGAVSSVTEKPGLQDVEDLFCQHDEALNAVSQWTFTSGELKGQKVPVLVRLVVTFRMR
jgi:hypothetical protein